MAQRTRCVRVGVELEGRHLQPGVAEILQFVQEHPTGERGRDGRIQQDPEMPAATARLHQTGQPHLGERAGELQQLRQCVGGVAVHTEPPTRAVLSEGGEGDRRLAGQMRGQDGRVAGCISPATRAVPLLERVGLRPVRPELPPRREERGAIASPTQPSSDQFISSPPIGR